MPAQLLGEGAARRGIRLGAGARQLLFRQRALRASSFGRSTQRVTVPGAFRPILSAQPGTNCIGACDCRAPPRARLHTRQEVVRVIGLSLISYCSYGIITAG